ncbi:hypothetical protein [Microbacterium paludicola]|uniref:hypothetical protein n=1 Tax=Microbacterium paludicola TaxID=300019 RepID=UPI0031D8F527
MSTPNGAPYEPAPQQQTPQQQAPHQAPAQGTAPAAVPGRPQAPGMPKVLRGAIWIAIGALIAAAIVCVVWVLIGPQSNELVGRAFLTIVLLAGFSACVLLEASLAERRPPWLVLASMVGWVLVLLVGAVKIWAPFEVVDDGYGGTYTDENVAERIWHLLLAIGLVQLAVWTQHFLWKAHQRHVTTFTRAITIATTALTGALVLMLLFFLAFADTFDFHEFYWRLVVALAILAVVGTLMIPLLNALFAPKKPRPAPYAAAPGYGAPQAAPQLQQWPTYADGRTPLPVMPDGSPDWNAYYTGVPTAFQAPAPAPQAPMQQQPPAQQPPMPQQPVPPVPPAPQPPVPPVPPYPGDQGGHMPPR